MKLKIKQLFNFFYRICCDIFSYLYQIFWIVYLFFVDAYKSLYSIYTKISYIYSYIVYPLLVGIYKILYFIYTELSVELSYIYSSIVYPFLVTIYKILCFIYSKLSYIYSILHPIISPILSPIFKIFFYKILPFIFGRIFRFILRSIPLFIFNFILRSIYFFVFRFIPKIFFTFFDFILGFVYFIIFSYKTLDFWLLALCDFLESSVYFFEFTLLRYFEIFLYYYCEVTADIIVYFINTFYLHFFIIIPFRIKLYFWRLNDKICFFIIKSIATYYLIRFYWLRPKQKKVTTKELNAKLIEKYNTLCRTNQLFMYSEDQIFLRDLRVLKNLGFEYYIERGPFIFILHYHYYMIKVNVFYMIEIFFLCIEEYFIRFHVPILIIGVHQMSLAFIAGGWLSAAYQWIVKGHKACLYYYLVIMTLPLLILGPICRAFRIASKNYVQNDPFIHIMLYAREEDGYTLISDWCRRMKDVATFYETTVLSCFVSTSTFWYLIAWVIPSFIGEYSADEPIYYMDDDEVVILHAIHFWLYETKLQSFRPTTSIQRPFWKEFFYYVIALSPSFFCSTYLDWRTWVFTKDGGNKMTLGPKYSRQQGCPTYRYKYYLPTAEDKKAFGKKYKYFIPSLEDKHRLRSKSKSKI